MPELKFSSPFEGSMPPGWYALLAICSITGVSTWYFRNFTERDDIVKLSAGIGICSMLGLVLWTYSI